MPHGKLRPEQRQQVRNIRDDLSSVADQQVRPRRPRVVYAARNRRHGATEVQRLRRRVDRARLEPRLDHHRDPTERRDQAIPARKAARSRPRTRLHLRDHCPAANERLMQCPVGDGIRHVDAGPLHADRPAALGQRRSMGGGVDAAGESADHHQPCPRARGRQSLGDADPIRRRFSGADDRHMALGSSAQRLGIAEAPKACRWARKIAEALWEVLGADPARGALAQGRRPHPRACRASSAFCSSVAFLISSNRLHQAALISSRPSRPAAEIEYLPNASGASISGT